MTVLTILPVKHHVQNKLNVFYIVMYEEWYITSQEGAVESFHD